MFILSIKDIKYIIIKEFTNKEIMIYLISAIILIGSILYILKRIKSKSQRIFFILILIVLYLVATGKAHWISALVIGLIPIVKKLFFLLRYLPIIRKFTTSYKNNNQQERTGSMSRNEAIDILGVRENSSKQEIIFAYKKEMQKHHPDKGGSFTKMTKDELEAYGRTIGIELDKRLTEEKLIEQLSTHLNDMAIKINTAKEKLLS